MRNSRLLSRIASRAGIGFIRAMNTAHRATLVAQSPSPHGPRCCVVSSYRCFRVSLILWWLSHHPCLSMLATLPSPCRAVVVVSPCRALVSPCLSYQPCCAAVHDPCRSVVVASPLSRYAHHLTATRTTNLVSLPWSHRCRPVLWCVSQTNCGLVMAQKGIEPGGGQCGWWAVRRVSHWARRR